MIFRGELVVVPEPRIDADERADVFHDGVRGEALNSAERQLCVAPIAADAARPDKMDAITLVACDMITSRVVGVVAAEFAVEKRRTNSVRVQQQSTAMRLAAAALFDQTVRRLRPAKTNLVQAPRGPEREARDVRGRIVNFVVGGS